MHLEQHLYGVSDCPLSYSIDHHTFQGQFLHHLCIFNRTVVVAVLVSCSTFTLTYPCAVRPNITAEAVVMQYARHFLAPGKPAMQAAAAGLITGL